MTMHAPTAAMRSRGRLAKARPRSLLEIRPAVADLRPVSFFGSPGKMKNSPFFRDKKTVHGSPSSRHGNGLVSYEVIL